MMVWKNCLNAGDGYLIACSCMLICWGNGTVCKRPGFLQASNAYSMQQVPDLHSFCIHHLVFYRHIFSCNVLDFSLRLDDSTQTPNATYKVLYFICKCYCFRQFSTAMSFLVPRGNPIFLPWPLWSMLIPIKLPNLWTTKKFINAFESSF